MSVTRRVIGWAMHQILDARLVIAALRMALLQRRPRTSSSSTPIAVASSLAPLIGKSSLNMAWSLP